MQYWCDPLSLGGVVSAAVDHDTIETVLGWVLLLTGGRLIVRALGRSRLDPAQRARLLVEIILASGVCLLAIDLAFQGLPRAVRFALVLTSIGFSITSVIMRTRLRPATPDAT